jgi:hypothetical protein
MARGPAHSCLPTPVARQTTPRTPVISREATPATQPTTPEPGIDSDDKITTPIIIASPVKRRQRKDADSICTKIDSEVWDLTDEAIIGKLL